MLVKRPRRARKMAHEAPISLAAASERWGHTSSHQFSICVSSSQNLLPGQIHCNRISVQISLHSYRPAGAAHGPSCHALWYPRLLPKQNTELILFLFFAAVNLHWAFSKCPGPLCDWRLAVTGLISGRWCLTYYQLWSWSPVSSQYRGTLGHRFGE